MPIKSELDVGIAARAVYDWLLKPACPLRAYLQIRSSATIAYAAQLEEQKLRANVLVGKASPDRLSNACTLQLCTSRGTILSQDDAALTQG